jgi:hypothetical protein
MEHLDNRTIEFLKTCTGKDEKEKKIAFIKKTPWIPHSAVEAIYLKMQEILEHPRIHRMPDLLILARPNQGKTTLLNRFAKINCANLDPDTGELSAPVIAAVMPHDPTEGLFVNALLGSVQFTVRKNDTFSNKLDQLYKVLENIDCKVILLDEIQHIGAGTMREQRLIMNMIKNISTNLQLSFIVAGAPSAANIFSFDDQLKSRFIPAVIPPWSEGEEFDSLLASFESLLPFEEPSDLASEELSRYILANTDRTIGNIYDLLKLASIYAIKKGEKKITRSSLNKCGHMSPQKIEEEKSRIY